METICPRKSFSFGPPATKTTNSDPRYYVIMAWGEALTQTHCDRGAQAVLYHTHQGENRFIGVPAHVACLLQAAREALGSKRFKLYNGAAKLEGSVLHLLGCHGLLEYGDFEPSETLLILPRGGHAVLAGCEGKTVYAGEWWCTDIPKQKDLKKENKVPIRGGARCNTKKRKHSSD